MVSVPNHRQPTAVGEPRSLLRDPTALGEILLQGKSNLAAPWLGLTGFLVIAIMLSPLVFIGEAMRAAFNPRKTLYIRV